MRSQVDSPNGGLDLDFEVIGRSIPTACSIWPSSVPTT